jgi:hypothetical protein
MNTNPDEATLALWLDDELSGAELAAVEAWAVGQPDQLAAREEIRTWRRGIASALPAAEEPPYPDFFNTRIMKAIREESSSVPAPSIPRKSFRWNAWLMPLAACAGMVLSFWVGSRSAKVPEIDVTGAPRAIPVEPVLYTPERGVEAVWFASNEASATVIVLNGVAAIPDTTDFSETVSAPMDREIDNTAGTTGQPEIPATP